MCDQNSSSEQNLLTRNQRREERSGKTLFYGADLRDCTSSWNVSIYFLIARLVVYKLPQKLPK